MEGVSLKVMDKSRRQARTLDLMPHRTVLHWDVVFELERELLELSIVFVLVRKTGKRIIAVVLFEDDTTMPI